MMSIGKSNFRTMIYKMIDLINPFLPKGFWSLYDRIKYGIYYRILLYKVKPLNKINKDKAQGKQFVISMTSYGKRLYKKAPFALASIFHQSEKPDRIVLWLAHGTKIPKRINRLISKGLEVKFCEDIGSKKKIIPAVKEFPHDVIITADDDSYYPQEWFGLLKDAHLESPHKIFCHLASEILLSEDKIVQPMLDWRGPIQVVEYSKRIYPVGVGGILYPPNSFNDELFNKEMFQKVSPTSEDAWSWAMSRYAGTESAVVKNRINGFRHIVVDNDGLNIIHDGQGQKDQIIQNILKEYPVIYQRTL